MIDLMSLLVYFNALIDKMLATTSSTAIMYLVTSYAATVRWLFTNMQQNLLNSVNNNISNANNEFTNTEWEPLVIEKQPTITGFNPCIIIPSGYFYMSDLQYCMPSGLQIYMEIKSSTPTTPPSSDGLLVDLNTTGYQNGGAYSLSTASGLSAHYMSDTIGIGQGFE